MNYYFAPLEGITGLSYRRMHHKYFGGVDKYYMPFLSPTQTHCLSKKEQRELPPREHEPYEAVPQILTKSAEDFLWAAQCCAERGYSEVNLNIGCPSGTVVSKGKGSGMLKNTEYLEKFLTEIFQNCPLEISVKTRIGLLDREEFPEILSVLNLFPIKELTVHPRIQKQFYKGSVDLEQFTYAIDHSPLPLCYNGDICNIKDLKGLQIRFPQISSYMIGRGLLADPGMLIGGTKREDLLPFHEELFDEYCVIFGDRNNAMARMKELWSMLICLFQDSESYWKKLRKCSKYQEFRSLSSEILNNTPMYTEVIPSWQERSLMYE